MARVSAGQHLIDVRGVRLAVEIAGDGLTLLYAHGMTGSRQQDDENGYWDWSIPARAGRFVRYDARGHGESQASLDPRDYRWPKLALDMLELAHALGFDRFMAGGTSMGCATALYAALAAPERVTGLVLVMPPTAWETRTPMRDYYGHVADLMAAQGLAQVIELIRRQPEVGFWPRELTAGKDRYLRCLASMDERTVAAIFSGARQSDLPPVERLEMLNMPALILALADDPGHPLSTAQALATHLPRAELSVACSLAELRIWPELIAQFLSTER